MTCPRYQASRKSSPEFAHPDDNPLANFGVSAQRLIPRLYTRPPQVVPDKSLGETRA